MKKIITTLFLCLIICSASHAQKLNTVAWMSINNQLYELNGVSTQTEIKPGWKIADIAETKAKSQRYVWGPRSRQLAESNRPTFVLKTQGGTLHDYLIVKMKQKKQYRKFPKIKLEDCNPLYIDLTTFRIELLPDERYKITPLQPLSPGEYVIVDTSAKPSNEYGDITVYGFTVEK